MKKGFKYLCTALVAVSLFVIPTAAFAKPPKVSLNVNLDCGHKIECPSKPKPKPHRYPWFPHYVIPHRPHYVPYYYPVPVIPYYVPPYYYYPY